MNEWWLIFSVSDRGILAKRKSELFIIYVIFPSSEHIAGYSGSGVGWETLSGAGRGTVMSGTGSDGWEEHSGYEMQGDDEDY